MTRTMLTGNAAAAWGARLAAVDYVPAFPITPQTEIVETLARWCRSGEMAARLVMMDSEHSMLAAAAGAAAAGVRVFTATSSQGLLYGFEMLYVIAGLRLPLVLVNVSRALAHPITLEPDHNDVLSARDSGFLQFHCETSQEVLDSILIAYRLAEDAKILLPAIVNLDGFYLSFTREAVELPEAGEVNEFLPSFTPAYPVLSGEQPAALGAAVLDSSLYSYFKHQMHHASDNALALYPAIAEEFAARFGRRHAIVEEYHARRRRLRLRHDQLVRLHGQGGDQTTAQRRQKSRPGAAAHDPAFPPRRIAAHPGGTQGRCRHRSKHFRRQRRHPLQRDRQRPLQRAGSPAGIAVVHRRPGRPPVSSRRIRRHVGKTDRTPRVSGRNGPAASALHRRGMPRSGPLLRHRQQRTAPGGKPVGGASNARHC